MSMGLFEMLKEVGTPSKISDFLNHSSFDELIEFDLKKQKIY